MTLRRVIAVVPPKGLGFGQQLLLPGCFGAFSSGCSCSPTPLWQPPVPPTSLDSPSTDRIQASVAPITTIPPCGSCLRTGKQLPLTTGMPSAQLRVVFISAGPPRCCSYTKVIDQSCTGSQQSPHALRADTPVRALSPQTCS